MATITASAFHLAQSPGINRLPAHLLSMHPSVFETESRPESSGYSSYNTSNSTFLTSSSSQQSVASGSTSRGLEQCRHVDGTTLSSDITTASSSSRSTLSSASTTTTATTETVVGSSISATRDDISISSTTAVMINNNSSNSHKEMPFYGLPPEILQHIASFLPFHGLVRLYTCLPKIHRPIFQLLLDHSLALMMLTLEIRQQSNEQPPTRDSLFVSVNNNPNGVGAPRKLQTHWRVTDFDLDHMRVEFQLEEKLGLEMAERRRQEIEYQIRQNKKAQQDDPLAATREQVERSHRGQEDFENLIWRSRTGGMSSSNSTSSLIGSRRQSSSSTASSEVEVSDSNFFHCNGSSHTPTLGSATVSFKAQRNMPAPWVSQYFDFSDPATSSPPSSGSIASSSSSAPPVVPESPSMIRARERVAAYRQNRLLLRALAKMRCCEESNKLQFLPVTVELETEELGQKKVEAELVEPDNNSSGVHRHPSSGHRKASPTTTAWSSSSSINTAKLGRRHSWQAVGSTDRPGTGTGAGASASHHRSPLEPLLNFGSDLSSHGLSKALKRILRRTSWNGNSSRSHATSVSASSATTTTTGCSVCDPRHYHHHYYQHHPYHQQQQQQHQRRSMDSLRTVDWSSVFHSVASSMHRSSSSHPPTTPTTAACQCLHRKAVLLTTSKQQDPATTAAKTSNSIVAVAKRRSFSNMVAGYRKGKSSTASASETLPQQKQGASLLTTKNSVNKGKGKSMTSEPTTTITSSQEQKKEKELEQQQEQHQKLFEFSYGVRHNYLHSYRLEGERVIRPIRFACSLDFFIQD